MFRTAPPKTIAHKKEDCTANVKGKEFSPIIVQSNIRNHLAILRVFWLFAALRRR